MIINQGRDPDTIAVTRNDGEVILIHVSGIWDKLKQVNRTLIIDNLTTLYQDGDIFRLEQDGDIEQDHAIISLYASDIKKIYDFTNKKCDCV